MAFKFGYVVAMVRMLDVIPFGDHGSIFTVTAAGLQTFKCVACYTLCLWYFEKYLIDGFKVKIWWPWIESQPYKLLVTMGLFLCENIVLYTMCPWYFQTYFTNGFQLQIYGESWPSQLLVTSMNVNRLKGVGRGGGGQTLGRHVFLLNRKTYYCIYGHI